MRPSKKFEAKAAPLSSFGRRKGGGRPKMLARSGFLHVENVFG